MRRGKGKERRNWMQTQYEQGQSDFMNVRRYGTSVNGFTSDQYLLGWRHAARSLKGENDRHEMKLGKLVIVKRKFTKTLKLIREYFPKNRTVIATRTFEDE